MSEKTKKIIHLCYGIYLSVCIVAAAVLIIISCRALYNGGNALFSPETVAEKYSSIAIPLQICVLSIVIGFILQLALPLDSKKGKSSTKKPQINYSMVLSRMQEMVDVGRCDTQLSKKVKTQRLLRTISTSVCAFLCAVTSVPMLMYICNPNNYIADTKEGTIACIVSMALRVGLWCLVCFIFCLANSFVTWNSKKKEIELLRAALKEKVPAPESKYTPEKEKRRNIVLLCVRGTILVVAVVFIVLGIFNGGMNDVLQKAIKLCTECVGLG